MPADLTPSNADSRKFKIASVQAEPVWLDLRGGVSKTIALIQDAANQGAKIIGFPEVFIPGYPWTPWANSFLESRDILYKYQANSLGLNSPEMAEIKAACKAAGAWVVLGFSERDGGSLYIAQVIISPEGEIVHHRRKIKPTHYEKTLFGDGNPQSVQTVVQTPYGRLGALNCWEQMQPALKAHFYTELPQIFVGSWAPGFTDDTPGCPFIMTTEAFRQMTRGISMEGGCFGISAGQVISEEGAKLMKINNIPWFKYPGGGCSAIYGPDGTQLTEPINADVEKILIAEISLSQIDEIKIVADTMGNYSRHDLVHVVANKKNYSPATYKYREEDEEVANLNVPTTEV